MSAIHRISPQADVISKKYALHANITAAKSLMQILRTNLGPKGTLKMLVGGAGQIKLTKDGYVLLSEMSIQHPTAALIARTAAAQDAGTGDGSTSAVLMTGELLRQCEMLIAEDVHPRILVDGILDGKLVALKFLETFKQVFDPMECKEGDARPLLCEVARTSLRTKLDVDMADQLTEICVDACSCIKKPNMPLDLHMIEILTMQHNTEFDTRLVRGMVLDHGARHPNMPKRSEKCFILVANVCLEYENTEVHSGFFYKSAEQREKLVKAERANVDGRVQDIINLKNEACSGENEKNSFILINQGGIDPISLDALQKNSIVGIRRAKRRNMERLPLCCGGYAVNSTKDLALDCLGYAGLVYEHSLGDDKFTFIEEVKNPTSVSIIIKGAHKHVVMQIKDAIRDGLRAVNNVYNDKFWIPGAGAFELACHDHLMKYADTCKGRSKLGIQALANSMLVIPKTLAINSGFDQQDTMLKLQDELKKKPIVGLCVKTGGTIDPKEEGIWDNYCVKSQCLYLACGITSQLLSVDEIMRAGRRMQKS